MEGRLNLDSRGSEKKECRRPRTNQGMPTIKNALCLLSALLALAHSSASATATEPAVTDAPLVFLPSWPDPITDVLFNMQVPLPPPPHLEVPPRLAELIHQPSSLNSTLIAFLDLNRRLAFPPPIPYFLFPAPHPRNPVSYTPQVRRMEDFFEIARLAGRRLGEPQFQVAVRDWEWFESPGRNSMSTSHDIAGGTLGISTIPYAQLFDSSRLPLDTLVPLSRKKPQPRPLKHKPACTSNCLHEAIPTRHTPNR